MTETAELTASDGAASDLFGFAVSISGDTVVIGSPFHQVGQSKQGSAYVFVKPAGEWNRMEIRAEGRRVVVVLNGVLTWITLQMSPNAYGYGFALALLILVVGAVLTLDRKFAKLEYETYMLHN